MEKRKARVLVADDEPHIRALISMIISSLGGDVVAEAGDGEQALRLFELHRPDMVLLDINMPKVDGLHVLKKIMEASPDTMVVMLTSLNSTEVVKQCLERGARNYILKNLTAAELRQEISTTWADFLLEISGKVSP